MGRLASFLKLLSTEIGASGIKYYGKDLIKLIRFRFVYNGSLFVTVLPAKSDSDDMLCLQSYQGLVIDKSLVY